MFELILKDNRVPYSDVVQADPSKVPKKVVCFYERVLWSI